VVLSGKWLVNSILFLLPTRLFGTVRYGKTASLCIVVRAVIFTRWQLHCSSAAALFGQLFLQQGESIQFECCLLCQRSALGSTTCPALRGWPITHPRSQPLCLSQSLLGASSWHLWAVGLSPHSHSWPLCLS
jgi:hypothetical protein